MSLSTEILKASDTRAENRQYVLEWIVPSDLPFFNGHFPGQPILPGFYVVEKSVQTLRELLPLLKAELTQAKFLAPIEPNESLRIVVKLDYPRVLLSWLSGAEQKKKAEVEFRRV